MANARYSIGIDLGTTNSALAFVPLEGDAPTEVLAIPQWLSSTATTEAATLPSFLYLPEDGGGAELAGAGGDRGQWIVGALARRRAAETPGRVTHSAKSWLCHHAADRTRPFLPWGSDEIAPEHKISPVRAQALILNALMQAWDRRFAAAGADFRFAAQAVTVTVPASFDVVAQRLTLTAAAEAGYPASVRLLEEPQAAFYRWLEGHDAGRALWSQLAGGNTETLHVLVVDIGGGTSDFSLFALQGAATGGDVPAIRRIAVSDHILLGGDNMDLALAHVVEPRLTAAGGKLGAAQWNALVARCRDLKETVLAREGEPEESFSLAIAGRGAGLIAGALSAHLTRGEITAAVLEGFFPACDAAERPRRVMGALREWGLPFAADSAITRHLAEFLGGRPPVDALLCNGGALAPASLRRRLVDEIGKWQGGRAPLLLDNAEPDLAVARGAARFGKILHRKADRIAAGAARALFLAAHRVPTEAKERASVPALLCILPQGAAAEQRFAIAEAGLALRLNQPVRFEVYSSTRHADCAAGSMIDWNPRDFHRLPPLETVAKVAGAAARTLPVTLESWVTELGLLQVTCRSAEPQIAQSWPLEFNLRPLEQAGEGEAAPVSGAAEPTIGIPPAALAAARERIKASFGAPGGRREKVTATRLLTGLEKAVGLPKGQWSAGLIRALWPALEARMAARATSVEHEETWLILAGFLLRPGFGVALDEARIDALWRLRTAGLCFPGKRIALQVYILWRRVAGGLSHERQEQILAGEIEKIRRQAPPPELVRLAGALERVNPALKAELIGRFLDTARALMTEGKAAEPWLSALGLLLNRTPLYAGPETVVAPELVEHAFDALRPFDWAEPAMAELSTLFLRAARAVENRSLDVPKALRLKIARKLEQSGVAPLRTAKLKEVIPLDRAERQGLYGEALPPGLLLREPEA
ncbi:MAG: Hsp70 family protein [Rhodospirillales bacterium]|nr:Hsp70 family protein [Rhodospirillales bacterium]